jgi:hypothetical protein
MWILKNGKIIKTNHVTHFQEGSVDRKEHVGFVQLAHLEASCRAKGWSVITKIMNPTKDSYKEAKSLWNNPEEYIAARM